MKINLRTLFSVLVWASIFACSPGLMLAQQGNRSVARTTYNESLKRLFVDVEEAKTSEQLRAARSRATEGFKRAVQQDPTYSLPYYNLGVLAEADGDVVSAIKHFEQFKTLSNRPDLSAKAQQKLDYLRSLSSSSGGAGDRRKAEYEQSLGKMKALINLGLMKEAISIAARVTQLEPTRWEAYALIGAALFDQKLFAHAHGFLQLASARAPAEVRAKLLRAVSVCEANMKR